MCLITSCANNNNNYHIKDGILLAREGERLFLLYGNLLLRNDRPEILLN